MWIDIPKNIYDNRLVAFLDILGFSNAIKNANERDEKSIYATFGALEKTKQYIYEEAEKKEVKSLQITIMSDSIVISIKKKEENATYIFLDAIYRRHFYIEYFLVRGGIAVGKLYHKENIVFGPAFIAAYNIEKDEAKVPRIVAAADFIKILDNESKKYFYEDTDEKIYYRYLDFEESNSLYSKRMHILNFYYLYHSAKYKEKEKMKYAWLLKHLYVWSVEKEDLIGSSRKVRFIHTNLKQVEQVEKLDFVIVQKILFINEQEEIVLTNTNQLPNYTTCTEKISLKEFVESIAWNTGKITIITVLNGEEKTSLRWGSLEESIWKDGCFSLEKKSDNEAKKEIAEVTQYTVFRRDTFEIAEGYRCGTIDDLKGFEKEAITKLLKGD